jgi:hypothetical protein
VRRSILPCVCLLMLVCSALPAGAGGVSLAWGTQCYSEHPIVLQTFACNTNAVQAWSMTVSFMADADVTDLAGVEVFLVGMADSPMLPDWWKVGAASDCRFGMVSFHSDESLSATEVCADWTGGLATDAHVFTWGGSQAALHVTASLAGRPPVGIIAGQEYYAGTVTIRNGATVGTGACTGCSVGMQWAVLEVLLLSAGGGRTVLDGVLPGGGYCLSWNDSKIPCSTCRSVLCTDSRPSTWGEVKTLYR